MKLLFLSTLPFVTYFLVHFFQPDPPPQDKPAGVVELTDKPDVVFARNLRNWRNIPIDSIMMDLFYPTGATSDKKYPVIVFCHGGGFSGGNRHNVSSMCDRYADMGYIAVAIDYRVGYDKGKGDSVCYTDTSSFNLAVYRACQDVNAAFRYLSAHADELNVDTSGFFLAGSSAGAMLTLIDAYLTDSIAKRFYPEAVRKLGSLQKSGNSYPYNYQLKGAASMWGALMYADQWINKEYTKVPVILFKGDEEQAMPDSIGSYAGCTNLGTLYTAPAVYTILRNQGIPSVFHFLPLGNHPAFDIDFVTEQSNCFFQAILSKKPYSGRYEYFDPSCQ